MSDSFPVQLQTSITNQTQNKVDDLHSKAVGKGLMPGNTCAITSCRKEEKRGEKRGGEGRKGIKQLTAVTQNMLFGLHGVRLID